MISLSGKTAFVTGSAQGIGKAIAFKMAEAGASIVIGDVNQEKIDATVAEFTAKGFACMGQICDVTNPESVETLVKAAQAKFGKIDILVNNAGITQDTLFMRMEADKWNRVLEVNLTGAFHTTKAVIRDMAKNRFGRVINISSVVGVIGNIGQANYAASKAGMIGFTKSIAKEYASRNITANAVAPGFIETGMTHVLTEEVKEEFFRSIPLKRMGSPDDVANAVVFLASDNAAYITGQVIHVDGGMVM